MAALALPKRRAASGGAGPLGLGIATLWLSTIVLLPLAAVLAKSLEGGVGGLVDAITAPSARAALLITVGVSAVVALINVFTGTLIAWVLVRDDFRGKSLVNAIIDLPFALPTIVAGLTLLALYGRNSPIGIDISYTKWAVLGALLFVTMPFVVRSVQPVLIEVDREMEQAAISLGASNRTVFTRIILPNLLPAILSGAGLAFARAVGEFGSIVLISGNIPFDTQVSSVYIFKLIESDAPISAAAVSVVLLLVSVIVLAAIRFLGRWGAKHQ